MPVAASMPAITAVPRTRRPAAPAPVAIQSGRQPSTNANDVIRIGRSRRRAASRAASVTFCPRSTPAFANSTMRIAFLAARPISMTSPICPNTSSA